ncbi:hypothetical protein T484DRAFT_1833398 [Baffinella frigidus]|nr:hypothetical protein T484DRAFT_1833398 [Cryptophyta sp. CCMP2293]
MWSNMKPISIQFMTWLMMKSSRRSVYVSSGKSLQEWNMLPPGMSHGQRFKLSGARVIVTGGTKGIAPLDAQQLGSAAEPAQAGPEGDEERSQGMGARVFTCSRNENDLKVCLDKWAEQGMDVAGMVADCSKKEDRQALVLRASEAFDGRLDVLVNNVGTNVRKPTGG